MALYGDPDDRNPCSILDKPRTREQLSMVNGTNKVNTFSTDDDCSLDGSRYEDLSEYEDSSEEEEDDNLHMWEDY